MHAPSESKVYADLLEAIPAFSSYTRSALEDFASHGVIKLRCAAGTVLSAQTDQDQNMYVIAAGSALLAAGDGVLVDLAPGDYFGHNPGHHQSIVASVVAVSDVAVLVLNAPEVARSASHRAPTEWRTELSSTIRRATRRSHRRSVLVRQNA
ncbi:MAG TPA: cyclic nucleotide-binding domain-containing protein [Acidimicrobiales bacterium]|jgi:CRP-like cAMP-binding protein|nr:cyclic nucleotide-binding domain-containing protein [Acidimicrobiales bacterium]